MDVPIAKQAMGQELDQRVFIRLHWLEVFGNDEGRDAGIWKCSAGKYRPERTSGELCCTIFGHLKSKGDDSDEYEVETGDVLYLRQDLVFSQREMIEEATN